MNGSIKHTNDFLQVIRSNGRYAFTIDELIEKVPKTVKNIRKDLDRLRDKGEVINIRRGFYTVIPVEYQKMGSIPVELYIDELMRYLAKKYYVGLISAAMFHGAAHQQPQEFFVLTQSPKPRTIKSKNTLINFSEKKILSTSGIEEKKTDTGYFKISNKELTFLDLIYFEQGIGGFNRIISVLRELSESISITRMKEAVKIDFPVSTFQRAGFIAEHILMNDKLASIFENKLATESMKKVFLKSSTDKTGIWNEKWKLIVNSNIEDEI
ncbi:MAG: type IV toxin-antitoxin system AbiEi family antitoxin domain-containing protein [Bacteroidales bacterium]|nr:type IV toxin-antitoxin system AbiEi family antitoxin domain-containing protein [Bacteroidales bacterium]